MNPETIKKLARLGYVFGQNKAAADVGTLINEQAQNQEIKQASSVAVLANHRAMEKCAEVFNVICRG